MKKYSVQKLLVMMIVLNILLALSLVVLTIYLFAFHPGEITDTERFFLPVISLISLSGAVPPILLLRPVSVYNVRLKQTESSLDNLTKLNNTLRAQRHDFSNHLQVVHSLIDLKEYPQANDYINNVYDSIEKVSGILRTGIPAVNAILESKRQTCENRGIEVVIDVSTTLSGISVPDWELCRLFGNIIDNSINALSGMQSGQRVCITIFDDIHSYKYRISNNGPAIPLESWAIIFEAGYTTGANEGEGMGLAICTEIANRYNGKIWVVSDEYETIFEGFFPKCG